MTAADFNKCVDDYADNVYRFILKNVKDSERARDIVQDAFEKLWMKHSDIDASKVKSYLFTAAYHTMIDSLRKDKRKAGMNEVKQTELSYNEHYSDLKELLNEAIGKLPEIQRSVIMLRDYEGYSYDEIGTITGLTEAQVKVYIYRARVFLKEYIGSIEAVM